jgi:hypothetical protein
MKPAIISRTPDQIGVPRHKRGAHFIERNREKNEEDCLPLLGLLIPLC